MAEWSNRLRMSLFLMDWMGERVEYLGASRLAVGIEACAG